MADAWQILRDAGLPLALPASDTVRTLEQLAAATREAIAQRPVGREAEALAAFVFAWHQHWPESFARELAGEAGEVVSWASEHAVDENRYLKLRRIALENLARIL